MAALSKNKRKYLFIKPQELEGNGHVVFSIRRMIVFIYLFICKAVEIMLGLVLMDFVLVSSSSEVI